MFDCVLILPLLVCSAMIANTTVCFQARLHECLNSLLTDKLIRGQDPALGVPDKYTVSSIQHRGWCSAQRRSSRKMVFPVCVCVFLERSELEEVRWPMDFSIELPWVGELQAILHVGLEPHTLRRQASTRQQPQASENQAANPCVAVIERNIDDNDGQPLLTVGILGEAVVM